METKVKQGDVIEFNDCCNASRKLFKGMVEYRDQLGLIVVVDNIQYEVKRLINIKII